MVELMLNLGSLEQGTISETGTRTDANDQIRTYNFVTNDYSFFKCIADIRAAVLKPVEGSMEGLPRSSPTTYDRVPSVPSDYTIRSGDFNNPNYKIEYYWWHSGTGNNYKRGCVALRLPIYNNAGNQPKAIGYRDASSSTYFNFDINYDTIDVAGNSITYTSNGETITKSITELLNASSDKYFAELKGERDSEDKPCKLALLGYKSTDAVIYSKRWEIAMEDNIIDFSEGLPIARWKFVLKVDKVSTLKPSHILNDHKKIMLQMDSWEMTQDNILINSGMCEEISGDILTYPFPKSFWELDENNKLEMFMLPEQPAEGSFMDCTSLEYVSIPESVQYIGKYAFTHTSLTRVRISRTCTYYPTSFPPGCEIWFYGDEMEPADDFYSKAEIDAMMIKLGILGLELFKISDLETRKISILEGD